MYSGFIYDFFWNQCLFLLGKLILKYLNITPFKKFIGDNNNVAFKIIIVDSLTLNMWECMELYSIVG